MDKQTSGSRFLPAFFITMEVRELLTLEEMTPHLALIQQLYPKLDLDKYSDYLSQMIPRNYRQIAVFDQGECIGLTGYWFNIKLWSGKYIELDNFIVHQDHRSKGVGKLICDFAEQIALERGCTNIVLDAYTTNFKAHRFYYNQGYGAKGFHFVKILDKEGLT
jgi:GNAT superfamily N-acetyltransferase